MKTKPDKSRPAAHYIINKIHETLRSSSGKRGRNDYLTIKIGSRYTPYIKDVCTDSKLYYKVVDILETKFDNFHISRQCALHFDEETKLITKSYSVTFII